MPQLNRSVNVIGRCAALYRERALTGTGVGPYDQSYLFYLCRNPGVSQDTLARDLYVNKSSVTRHLSHLEREGFLTRVPDEKDRRALLVYPTEKAMEVLPLLRRISRDWEALLTKGFSEEESERFLTLLERAFHNAQDAVREDNA